MSVKQEDAPYLEAPKKEKTTTEQLIYGGGDTLSEIKDKTKKEQGKLITE